MVMSSHPSLRAAVGPAPSVLLVGDSDPPNSQRQTGRECTREMSQDPPCAQIARAPLPLSSPSGSRLSPQGKDSPRELSPQPVLAQWRRSARRAGPGCSPAWPTWRGGGVKASLPLRTEVLLDPNVRKQDAVLFLEFAWSEYGQRTWLASKLSTH